MVSFRHDEDGTTETRWVEAGVLALPALIPGLLPDSGGKLVVVASHPDDETLGAGGMIFSALGAGASVHVIVCTSGEASHPHSPTHSPLHLASVRHTELGTALDRLSTGTGSSAALTWCQLGLPDGRLNQYGAVLEKALKSALQKNTPDTHARNSTGKTLASPRVVVAAPYRFDGHTDHDVAGAIAARVCERFECTLLEYPIWYWHWAHPGTDQEWADWKSFALMPAARGAKSAALLAHQSQISPLSPLPGDEVLLSAAFQEHFSRPVEIFRTSSSRPRGAREAAELFDGLYRRRPDPWNYLDSSYELHKRRVTLASLPAEHYDYAVEAGCSIGVLTADLATRCQHVLSLDASEVALASARYRLAGQKNIKLLRADLPGDWISVTQGEPDLVVVSEIGYFLTYAELRMLLEQIESSLRSGGHLLMCHWLHPVQGWELDGEVVHATATALGWQRLVVHRETDFLLEVFEPPGHEDA